ncbi:MAG: glycosyltransferase [Spirochaetales bacterium]|nr:glycosyltransferase [Spirochaetales bacterium]MCF7938042.1 glycosyltransferase [Spirochaetales bacterium]
MNIAYLSDTFWPRINGVTISVETFATALVNAGHNVLLLVPDYKTEDRKTQEKDRTYNFTVHRYSSYQLILTPDKEDRLVSPVQKKHIWNDLDKFQPDLVHVQTEFSLGRKGARYCKERGVPWIATSHTYFEKYVNLYFPWVPHSLGRWLARRSQRNFYNSSCGVITPTSQMKRVLEEYEVSVPIRSIPTGVNSRRFPVRPGGEPPAEAEEQQRLEREVTNRFPSLSGRRRLLFVGRVAHEKNVNFLVETHKRLRDKVSGLTTVLVGNGPEFEYLKALARGREWEDEFLLIGYQSPDFISMLYRTSDVFVFPSTTETQGLVTIEAMLSGLPVVAVGRMGTCEIMNGDNGGFMTEPDLDEFTSRVYQLLVDRKLWQEKSAEACRYAQYWTIDRSVEMLQDFYREVINRHHLNHCSPKSN